MDDPRQQQSPQSPGPSPSSPGDGDHSANSSTGSGKASQADAAAAFVSNPGPEFQPGDEPPPVAGAGDVEPPLQLLPSLEPEWEDEAVARLLVAKGELLHTFVGVADDDWRYTEADLRAIAPPLSRILNRYPATKAAAVGQDPLALAIATSAYAIRSAQERAAALKARAEEEVEQPVTGVDAHPGNQAPGPGPETPPDPDAPAAGGWQIAN